MVMERMSMMLFAIIIMINMTLLAVNQTGDVALFGGKGLGSDLNVTRIQQGFTTSIEQSNTASTTSCDYENIGMQLGCVISSSLQGVVEWASQTFDVLTGGMSMLFETGAFLLNVISHVLGGYIILINSWANTLETSPGGPIHLLLNGITGVITIMYIFGAINIIRMIAATVRGSA